MRFKKWRRVLTRYVKQPKSTAKQIRQWFGAPARTQRKYRRISFAIEFGRNKADAAQKAGKVDRAKWWRARIKQWAPIKARLRDKMEADLGPREIIPRSVWDPNPGDRATARMSNESGGLFVHHSVAGSPTTEEGERAEMRNLEAIARSRGFADFSYSFAIAPSGRIYEGRGRGIEGAHTIGFNDVAHAGCAMGNYETQVPTEAMLESYRWLIEYLEANQVRPHRAVYATSCPGSKLVAALF